MSQEDSCKKIVFVPSDMAGKPITQSIVNTFQEPVKIVNLVDYIVTTYDSEAAENLFSTLCNRVYLETLKYGNNATYYVICGGAVVNSVLAVSTLMSIGIKKENIVLLVWEKRQHRYLQFDISGKRVDSDGYGFEYEESEEDSD